MSTVPVTNGTWDRQACDVCDKLTARQVRGVFRHGWCETPPTWPWGR